MVFTGIGISSHTDFAAQMDTICAIAQTMEAPFNNISTGDIVESKVTDFASVLERYRCLVDTVQKTDFPVEMAKLSARGITVYSVDGITRELPAE